MRCLTAQVLQVLILGFSAASSHSHMWLHGNSAPSVAVSVSVDACFPCFPLCGLPMNWWRFQREGRTHLGVLENAGVRVGSVLNGRGHELTRLCGRRHEVIRMELPPARSLSGEAFYRLSLALRAGSLLNLNDGTSDLSVLVSPFDTTQCSAAAPPLTLHPYPLQHDSSGGFAK